MLKSVSRKLFTGNSPRWLVLVIDVYLVANTFILAYLIRFNFQLNFDTSKLLSQIPLVVGASLFSFLIIGSYKGIIRHTGFKDALNVFIASFVLMCLLTGLVLLIRYYSLISDFTIPLSIIVIHFLLNVVLLIATRYIFKEVYYFFVSDLRIDKNVVIYGAGEAGLLTYSVLNEDKESKLKVVGFMDDDRRKSGRKINGKPVYYSKNINEEFVEKNSIDEIILSIEHINPSGLIEIVDSLSHLSAVVKIIPPAKSWIDNDLNVKHIKSVRLEDLLGRKPVELNNPILKKEFNNKVILITGAAGSIGSELSRQIANYKIKKLILVDQAESDLYDLQQYFIRNSVQDIVSIVADVRNKKRIESIFEDYNPSIVFHAAAYKHVPFMEGNPYEAVAVNVYGTKNIVDLSVQTKVEKFVMVSTDKAVNPTNVMGASKRIAEMYVNSLNVSDNTKLITTRFGNVLGSNGSVIPLFQSQIESGGPITVTHKDVTRYFMTIPEACLLVLEAGTMGNGGEIFVFDMGESIKIFDLALNMIHLSGLNYPKDIDIKIMGLRPGEKIFEELLANGENTKATYHEKIMIADAATIDKRETLNKINEFCEEKDKMNNKAIVLKMKEIVPEFISNNSDFEQLDKNLSE